MNTKSPFKTRLKTLRTEAGLSQKKMANALNISRGLYNGLETGREEPSDWVVQQVNMVERLGVEILNKGDRLTTAAPAVVQEEAAPFGGRRVPIISWASAGELVSFEEIPKDWQQVIFTDCADPLAFAVAVDGDSMLPEFRPGDIVIVMPSQRTRNHAVVLAKLRNDGVVLKIFNLAGRDGKTFRLSSLNPAYQPTEYLEADFHWIYPVHSSRRLHWR